MCQAIRLGAIINLEMYAILPLHLQLGLYLLGRQDLLEIKIRK